MDLVEIGYKLNVKQIKDAANAFDKLEVSSKKVAATAEKVSTAKKKEATAVKSSAKSRDKLIASHEREMKQIEKMLKLGNTDLNLAQKRKVADLQLANAGAKKVANAIKQYEALNKLSKASTSANDKLLKQISLNKTLNSIDKSGLSASQAKTIAIYKEAGARGDLISQLRMQMVAENKRNAQLKMEHLHSQAIIEDRKREKAAMNSLHAEALKMNKARDVEIAKTKKVETAIQREISLLTYLKQGYDRTTASKLASAKASGVPIGQLVRLEQATKATNEYTKANGRLRLSTSKGVDVMSNFFFSFKLAIVASATVSLLKMADTMTLLQSRVKLVTPATQSVSSAMSELVDISLKTRASLTDTITLYNRLQPSLQILGYSTQDVNTVVEAFNNSLLVSGAKAKETASAILQFSQSMAAGKLAGDEFRAVTEAAPELLREVAKAINEDEEMLKKLGVTTKVTSGSLKELSRLGKLTPDILAQGLIDRSDELAEKAKIIDINIQQAMTNLRTSVSYIIMVFNNASGATSNLAKDIDGVAKSIKKLADEFAAGNLDDEIANFKAMSIVISSLVIATKAYSAAIYLVGDAAKNSTGKIVAFNAAIKANPIVAVISGIIALTGAIYGLSKASVQIGEKTTTLGGVFTAFFKTIQEKFPQAIAKVREGFISLKNWVVGQYTPIFKVVGVVAEKSFNFIKEYINKSIAIYTTLGSTLGKWSYDVVNNVKEAFSNIKLLASALWEDVTNVDLDFTSLRKALKEGMSDAFSSDFGETWSEEWKNNGSKDFIGNIVVGIKNAVKLGEKELVKFLEDTKNNIEEMGKGDYTLDVPPTDYEKEIEELGRYRAALLATGDARAAKMMIDKQYSSVQAENIVKINEENAALEKYLKIAKEIEENPLSQFEGISFDGILADIGNPFSEMVSSLSSMNAEMIEFNKAIKAAGKDEEKVAKIEKQRFNAQINGYANMVGAAKGFFNEKSKGYKALEKIELAFRAIQLAGMVQEMTTFLANTIVKVTGFGAVATAAGTAAVASAAIQPGPAAFVGAAAMMALLAGIGVKLSGGGKKGGSSAGALDIKSSQSMGAVGTVLGDAKEASNSILNALSDIESVESLQLKYSREMANSLSKIEKATGGVASGFASAAGIRGKQNLRFSGTAGNVQSEFGTKLSYRPFGTVTAETTQEELEKMFEPFLLDDYAGRMRKAQAIIKELQEAGIDPATQAALQRVENDINKTFSSIGEALEASVSTLGGNGKKALEEFMSTVVDFDLLEQKDIDEAVNKLFSSIADRATQAANVQLPDIDLTQFQEVGEGLFETLIRVASGFEAVSVNLERIGQSLNGIDVNASENLIRLFGGVGEFVSATQGYIDAIYTDAEKLAVQQADLKRVFDSLNLAIPQTNAQFKALVESLNLNTEAGQEAYKSLVNIAPLFAEVTKAVEDNAKEAAERAKAEYERRLQEAAERAKAVEDNAKEAAERAKAVEDNAKEAAERAKAEYERRLQEAENALRKAYDKERSELEKTINTFDSLISKLKDFSKSLVEYVEKPFDKLARLRFEFQDIVSRGLGGDTDALGQIPTAGAAYAKSIVDTAKTSLEANRELAKIRVSTEDAIDFSLEQKTIAEQQLDALNEQVGKLITINESVLSVKEALAAYNAALKGEGSSANSSGGRSSTSRSINPNSTEAWAERFPNDPTKRHGLSNPLAAKARESSLAANKISNELFSSSTTRGQVTADGIARLAEAQAQRAEDNYNYAAAIGKTTGDFNREEYKRRVEQAYTDRVAYRDSLDISNPSANVEEGRRQIQKLEDALKINAFATGGDHLGGLRMVGEAGMEIEATGPSRIHSNSQLSRMFDVTPLVSEIRDLRSDLRAGQAAIADNTQQTAKILRRFDDDDGLAVRVQA